MQPVMTVNDVRELEASIEDAGVDSYELMRRAGTVVAMQAMRAQSSGSVVVLAGMGNNGGDGWVAADYLARHGIEVSVVAPSVPALIRTAAARKAAEGAVNNGVPVHVVPDYDELVALLVDADVVVDAVFGTGFKGELPAPIDMWVEAVDDYFDGTLIAVDVPSGIDATTGMAQGAFFQADETLTMFALKPGLISGMGKEAAGKIVVAGLVGEDEGIEDISQSASAYKLSEADYADALPERDEYADKYGHGRVLVVAGSSRFPGAAIMAAKAAARSGAGYVTLAVPAPVAAVAQMHLLSVPVVGLPAAKDGTFDMSAAPQVAELAAKADCVLAGPGMGTSFGATEAVRTLLGCGAALVLDADALNIAVKLCAGSVDAKPDALRREAPLVLTPHTRELARLMGRDSDSVDCLAAQMSQAQNLCWSVGSGNFAVAAKGPISCVSCVETTLVPKPGPSALGTAGTGDVLAGVVAGLLAQQVCDLGGLDEVCSGDLVLLLAAAMRIQATAAEKAVERFGSRGIMASDLIDLVGVAFDTVQRRAMLALSADPAVASAELADEPQMALDPEVEEELITAGGGAGMRGVPGEVRAYEGDLDEPEPREAVEADEGAGDADFEEGADDEAEELAAAQALDTLDDEAASSVAEAFDQPAPAPQKPAAPRRAPISADSIIRPAVRVDADGNEVAPAVKPQPAEKPASMPAFLSQRAGASAPMPAVQAQAPAQADEPAAAAQQACVPSFLSRAAASAPMPAVAARQAAQPVPAEPVAPEPEPVQPQPAAQSAPAAGATTIMPALSLEDLARYQPVSAAPALSPDIQERRESRDRLEDFHARNSRYAGADEVTSPQERPHARKVRRKK